MPFLVEENTMVDHTQRRPVVKGWQDLYRGHGQGINIVSTQVASLKLMAEGIRVMVSAYCSARCEKFQGAN